MVPWGWLLNLRCRISGFRFLASAYASGEMGTRGGSECGLFPEGHGSSECGISGKGGVSGFRSAICNSPSVSGNLSFWDGAWTEHEGCWVSFWGPSCGGADCFRLVQIGAGATSEPSQCGVASAECGVGEGSEWGVSGPEGAGLMTLEV